MDQNHFDTLTRSLTSLPSRRDVLRGLASAGLALGVARWPNVAAAKKRKKPKRPKPNAFGCLSVGVACKNAGQCCSGICQGKRCRAHGTGTCKQGGPDFCTAENPAALACNNNTDCRCFGTTANSIACVTLLQNVTCATCKRDADCEDLGLPPGSVCVPISAG